MVSGGVSEDGPVMGLSLLLKGPKMMGSCYSDGPGMVLP